MEALKLSFSADNHDVLASTGGEGSIEFEMIIHGIVVE